MNGDTEKYPCLGSIASLKAAGPSGSGVRRFLFLSLVVIPVNVSAVAMINRLAVNKIL